MAVDKNLFLHDLAVVAILKNEAPYVKEWLDYHLLAGVDHFYLYDNESPDNLREVLKPYVERGIVTYKFYPGKRRQIEAYNEAVREYKFFCRYMAFIDGDEFILPKDNRSIVEVADEIFADVPQGGGIEINWVMYGSNFQDKADLSRGVLERFTRRASEIKISVKTIANPRRIFYLTTPHFAKYFLGCVNIRRGDFREVSKASYDLEDKIVVNHYRLKSREEFFARSQTCIDASLGVENYYNMSRFSHDKDNEVFDDSILKYRANRAEKNRGGGRGTGLSKCASSELLKP